jgi:hypothetical protein
VIFEELLADEGHGARGANPRDTDAAGGCGVRGERPRRTSPDHTQESVAGSPKLPRLARAQRRPGRALSSGSRNARIPRIAPTLDSLCDFLLRPLQWVARQLIIARDEGHALMTLGHSCCLCTMQGCRVLELGAGSGWMGLQLAKRFPAAHFTLTDLPIVRRHAMRPFYACCVHWRS